ncbi:alpha-amylase [Leptothoe spongobia]|uniref:alpha-amylase n=1 Tax=Leptothoe spongobia TaxID=2651728 RepID=UPI001C033753|nr:alpha-amylase family protein [Leptothoe spongobia]
MRPGPLAALARRWAAIVCTLSLGGCQVAAQLPPASSGRQVTSSNSVIVQLFEWSWPDIAEECEIWLGPHGYGAVQISPPHEHRVIDEEATPFPWYQRYQPVSYKLSSRSGNRAELANMVNRCHRAGVKVYVDMVINHMTSVGSGQGIAGSEFDTANFSYAGVPYAQTDFNEPCVIEASDYTEEPWRVQHCQLSSKQDLDTGSEKVQAELATAMNELLALGVAGFRLEAAQHIPPDHIAKILRRLRPLNTKFHINGGRPFIYQEVTHTGSNAIKANDYFGNGAVTEFRYGRNLGEQVRHGQLKNLVLFGEAWGLIPSHKAVVFTDNHNTQRSSDRNIVTFKSPEDDGASYKLANVFMLAWPYGIPKVMSSYDWPKDLGNWVGPPTDEQGRTLPVSCGNGWICEHRWAAIANMVEFRNVTQGATTVDHWWDNGNSQIAFARGDRGFVVINNESTNLRQTLMTGLPAGQYCNVLSIETATADHIPQEALANCMTTITVDADGKASFEIGPQQAVALHIGARL